MKTNNNKQIENKTFDILKSETFKKVREEYNESKKDIFRYLNIKRI